MNGGFFSMNLEAVQDSFQTLPWVRRVDVHRVWPGKLVVSLEEHKASAAWNDRASLNDHGEVFPVEPSSHLPRIYAPDGMEKILARRFVEFSQIVSPLNVRVEQVVVSPRQSWRVRLTGGITVELGRERINERLGRFTEAYPQAVAAIGPFQKADMRYPNGFAAQVDSRGTTANKASKA
jgi:cell division protein FtsQ